MVTNSILHFVEYEERGSENLVWAVRYVTEDKGQWFTHPSHPTFSSPQLLQNPPHANSCFMPVSDPVPVPAGSVVVVAGRNIEGLFAENNGYFSRADITRDGWAWHADAGSGCGVYVGGGDVDVFITENFLTPALALFDSETGYLIRNNLRPQSIARVRLLSTIIGSSRHVDPLQRTVRQLLVADSFGGSPVREAVLLRGQTFDGLTVSEMEDAYVEYRAIVGATSTPLPQMRSGLLRYLPRK